MKDYKEFQKVPLLNSDGSVADGTYHDGENVILKINYGYLNDEVTEDGTVIPAVTIDGACHIEHWQNGLLHCETEPAIIDNIDNYEEWWYRGKLVNRVEVNLFS